MSSELFVNRFPLISQRGNNSGFPSGISANTVLIEDWQTNPSIGGVTSWYDKTDQWSDLFGKTDMQFPNNNFKSINYPVSINRNLGGYLPISKNTKITLPKTKSNWLVTYIWRPYKDKVNNNHFNIPTRY